MLQSRWSVPLFACFALGLSGYITFSFLHGSHVLLNSLDRFKEIKTIKPKSAAESGIEPALKTQLRQKEVAYYVDAKANWLKYTADFPPLYQAPLTPDTYKILDFVASTSAELDQLYPIGEIIWLQHLEKIKERLIDVAVKGEREGARALSFQYSHSYIGKKSESLAWAIVANAIAPNDYYLYLCAPELSPCNDIAYEEALRLAEEYVIRYKFKLLTEAGANR